MEELVQGFLYTTELIELTKQLFEVLDKMDPDMRETWQLSMAANLLHDIDPKIRNRFLKEYEEIRKSVNEFLDS